MRAVIMNRRAFPPRLSKNRQGVRGNQIFADFSVRIESRNLSELPFSGAESSRSRLKLQVMRQRIAEDVGYRRGVVVVGWEEEVEKKKVWHRVNFDLTVVLHLHASSSAGHTGACTCHRHGDVWCVHLVYLGSPSILFSATVTCFCLKWVTSGAGIAITEIICWLLCP